MPKFELIIKQKPTDENWIRRDITEHIQSYRAIANRDVIHSGYVPDGLYYTHTVGHILKTDEPHGVVFILLVDGKLHVAFHHAHNLTEQWHTYHVARRDPGRPVPPHELAYMIEKFGEPIIP